MAKTVTDETDQGLFGLKMPFGGFKEAAEAIQVCCGVAMIRDGVRFPVTEAVLLHNHRNDGLPSIFFFFRVLDAAMPENEPGTHLRR